MSSFHLLPFQAQLAVLDEQLDAEEDPGALLSLCGALPDHGPLIYLLQGLSHRRRLAHPSLLRAFRSLLAEGPETAVQQALRALAGGEARELRQEIEEACLRLPLTRLPVLALTLRWLDRPARERLREEAIRRAVEALDQGQPLEDAWLVLAPRRALFARLPSPHLTELHRANEALAHRILDTLASGLRTLSQANAEELLARRVYEQTHHFFYELLQNADDAQATRARFSFGERELCLRHDGVPFDARDVLGVLSVGQSTKEASDIGLFGAGFKSVSAISDRPRIYSGSFSFEITSMSRPRRVEPLSSLDEDTLLALPLKPGLSSEELGREALQIPPEVLLTLRHLRTLSIQTPSREQTATLSQQGTTVGLQIAQVQRRYWLKHAPSGPLLIAIELDEDSLPRPRSPGAPSLYCFLPTREETGLPLLIQARFDVPLDRERIRRDSAENTRTLRDAGALLAELLKERSDAGEHRAVQRLLALLSEAQPPSFFAATLVEARQRLENLPLLPGADGQRLAASQAKMVPASLAAVLAGLPLDPQGRRALAPLPDEFSRAALWLGVPRMSPEDLLALLESVLAHHPEGTSLDSPLLDATAALAEVLAQLPPGALSRLAKLPWLRVSGGLFRASSVRLATGQQALLYGDLRPLRIEDQTTSQAWHRVGVAWLSEQEILEDLRTPPLRERLLRQSSAGSWLALLSQFNPSRLAQLAELPLFPDSRGDLQKLTGADAVWLWPPASLGSWLASLETPPSLLIHRAIEQEHGALLRLLGAQTFRVEQLGAWLQRASADLPVGALRTLVTVAEDQWRGWSPRELDAFLRAPIFEDIHGKRRPLRGEERAWRPEDEEISALAPEHPWLSSSLWSSPLLEGAAMPALGPTSVLTSLLGEGPLFRDWPDLAPLLAYLAPRAASLPRALCERLALAPRWPGEDGTRRPLFSLSRPTKNEAIERFYRALGLRPQITKEGAQLAAILGLEAHLATSDFDGIWRDLSSERIDIRSHRDALIDLLQQGIDELPERFLARLAELPLFLAEDGELRPLASWNTQSSAGPCYRAPAPWRALLERGTRPLLAQEEEARWGALLDATGCAPARLSDWLSALEQDLRLDTPEALLLARGTLVHHATYNHLAPLRPRLARLRFWRDLRGAHHRAEQLCLPTELAQLFPVSLSGVTALVHPEDTEEAQALSSLFSFRPAVALLDEWVRTAALPGKPLIDQPEALGSLENLWRLHVIEREYGYSGWPLGVDAEENLSAERLFRATPGEVTLLRGAPLLRRLALPGWASGPGLTLPLLPASRLLAELPSSLRERGEQERSELSVEHRALLFSWIEERVEELEQDAQARGLLGKLCVFPTREGSLRSPRELLLLAGLEDLSLPGRPTEELSPSLLALLSRLYQLEDTALDALILALVEASHLAAEADDRALLGRLNLAIAAALAPTTGASQVEHEERVLRIIRRHRLAKRLRFVSGQGPLLKARQLLVSEEHLYRSIPVFHTNPPPRYEGPPEIEPLLRLLGAESWLNEEALKELLRGEQKKSGLDATLALARYLAEAATATPALRAKLDLDRASWVPARDGSLHPPSRLFWPDSTYESQEDAPASEIVHPVFIRTAPLSLRRWFSFRRTPPQPKPQVQPQAQPKPAARPRAPQPQPQPEPPPKPRGIWQRLFGSEDTPAPPHPTPPPPPEPPPSLPSQPPKPRRRSQEDRWFQPQDVLSSQFDRTEGWSESRKQRPRYGFAHTPGQLPAPYVYAPALIASRFDASTQRWERGPCDGQWLRSRGRPVSRVRFRGEAPPGELVLPRSLYGEVLEVEGPAGGLAPSWTTEGLTLIFSPEEGQLSFEVELREAPLFQDREEQHNAPKELLEPTVPDSELPQELHTWLDTLLNRSASSLSRALQIRDFIQSRYRYDPSYLEDARVASWLRKTTEGSANMHVAALHAGRGGRHLGAGVCYELNALCCELLRRAGIPAVVSTGWVLSGEQVDEPDHLWAMALLPTDQGPRFLPLDASTTRDGTPLRVPRRPAGNFRRPAAPPARLPAAPAWARSQPEQAPAAHTPPIAELARTLRYLAQRQGVTLPDEGTLRRKVRALLDDPEKAAELLALIRDLRA